MLTTLKSAFIHGADIVPVQVETLITKGIGIHLVGLADAQVKESLLRTVTGIQSRGHRIPGEKIVINIAPADLRKCSSNHDAAIAASLVIASGQAKAEDDADEFCIIGEVALDGHLRAVRGALATVLHPDCTPAIIPAACAGEVAPWLDNVHGNVFAAETIDDVLSILCDKNSREGFLLHKEPVAEPEEDNLMDIAKDITGNVARAAALSVIAGKPLHLKTTDKAVAKAAARLVRRLLPDSGDKTLQRAFCASLAGMPYEGTPIVEVLPEHSTVRVIGDPSWPGLVTLAHCGVLFFEDTDRIEAHVLEPCRIAYFDRQITFARLKGVYTLPTEFSAVFCSDPGNHSDQAQRSLSIVKEFGCIECTPDGEPLGDAAALRTFLTWFRDAQKLVRAFMHRDSLRDATEKQMSEIISPTLRSNASAVLSKFVQAGNNAPTLNSLLTVTAAIALMQGRTFATADDLNEAFALAA